VEEVRTENTESRSEIQKLRQELAQHARTIDILNRGQAEMMSSRLLPPNRSSPPARAPNRVGRCERLALSTQNTSHWTVEFKNWKKQLSFLAQRLTNNIKLRSKPPPSIMRDFLASC